MRTWKDWDFSETSTDSCCSGAISSADTSSSALKNASSFSSSSSCYVWSNLTESESRAREKPSLVTDSMLGSSLKTLADSSKSGAFLQGVTLIETGWISRLAAAASASALTSSSILFSCRSLRSGSSGDFLRDLLGFLILSRKDGGYLSLKLPSDANLSVRSCFGRFALSLSFILKPTEAFMN